MAKWIRNQYDKALTYEKLMNSHKRSKSGKGLGREVILFSLKEEEYIEYLKEYKYPKFLNSYGYKISYIPYENQNETIILQENQMISGNNVDGFILSERVSDE